jgi:putative flippase GtrA
MSVAWKNRLRHLISFLFIGGVAFIIDVGLFNLLVHLAWFDTHPVSAKAASSVVAVMVSYLGNRAVTFRAAGGVGAVAKFVVVNIGGIGVAVVSLWVSRYVLGFTSLLADNIAGNIVGVGLGMTVRYIGYSRWVFPKSTRTLAKDRAVM